MGTPSLEDLRTIMQMNLVKDNQDTIEDVDLAQTQFGPDICVIKGKITQKKIQAQEKYSIPISQELIDKNMYIGLRIDIITINGVMFLTSISHELFHRISQFIPDKASNTLAKHIKHILNFYKKGNFIITTIHCNQEFKLVFNNHIADVNVQYASS